MSQRTSSANQLERRETRLRERWQRQLRERAGGLAELGEQQRAVLADVARAVLRAHGALPLDAPLLARVREADAKVSALVKRSELHLRALDAADAQKLRSGVGWLLVCLVALAALLAYRFHFAG